MTKTFEEIKATIETDRQNAPVNYAPSEGLRGSLIGTLNKACGSNENRKLFLKAIFGTTTSAQLLAPDWFALKTFVDSRAMGMQWIARPDFEKEVGVVMASVVKQEGQLNLL